MENEAEREPIPPLRLEDTAVAEPAAVPGEAAAEPPGQGEQPEQSHSPRAWRWAKRIGATALLAAGAAGGAVIGATHPATVPLSPHITASVRPYIGDQVDASFGVLGSLYLRESYPAPVLGNVSAQVTFPKFDLAGLSAADLGSFAAIASDPQTTLVEPLTGQFIRNSVIGGSAGLLGVAGLYGAVRAGTGAATKRWQRRRQRDVDDHKALTDGVLELADEINTTSLSPAQQERLDGLSQNVKVHAEQAQSRHHASKRHSARLPKRLAAAATIVSVGILSGVAYSRLDGNSTSAVPATAVPLDERLLAQYGQQYPILERITLSGPISGINQLINKSLDYMSGIDAYWQNSAKDLTASMDKFRQAGGMDWQYDPNIVPVMQISDVHDNIPFMKYFLPVAVNELGISVITHTGDQNNFSYQVPLDNNSMDMLTDSISPKQQNGRKVQIVFVAGNHDNGPLPDSVRKLMFTDASGHKYHPLLPLDKSSNYTATVDGVTFVGAPDPLFTALHDTQPKDPNKRAQLLAQQGDTIADAACKVFKDTDERPIVLAHEQEATYETIARGCASLDLSGHRHKTYQMRAYINDDGSISYQETLGSATGDGPGNLAPMYSEPTTAGDIRVYLYNKATDTVKQYVNVHIDPQFPPTITLESVPPPESATAAISDDAIRNFLDKTGRQGSLGPQARAQTVPPPSPSPSPGG